MENLLKLVSLLYFPAKGDSAYTKLRWFLLATAVDINHCYCALFVSAINNDLDNEILKCTLLRLLLLLQVLG